MDMNAIKRWMGGSTASQQQKLARLAKTSRNMLYQLASGHRVASPELAGRLERAVERMNRESKDDMDLFDRADVSPVCGDCPFARKCKRLR